MAQRVSITYKRCNPQKSRPAKRVKALALPKGRHVAVTADHTAQQLDLQTPRPLLVSAMKNAGLDDDLLLCALNATDVETLERTSARTRRNVAVHLRWLAKHPDERTRSVARLGGLVSDSISSYFYSGDTVLLQDIAAAALSEVSFLMRNPGWVNHTIATASFRLRRRTHGNTPLRNVLDHDTVYEPFQMRIACMLGVALGQEADMFATGAGGWDHPVAVGVCDICNENRVWANVPSDATVFACCHCMCKECTEKILAQGQPCPFCRTYDVWEFGQRVCKRS